MAERFWFYGNLGRGQNSESTLRVQTTSQKVVKNWDEAMRLPHSRIGYAGAVLCAMRHFLAPHSPLCVHFLDFRSRRLKTFLDVFLTKTKCFRTLLICYYPFLTKKRPFEIFCFFYNFWTMGRTPPLGRTPVERVFVYTIYVTYILYIHILSL